LQGNKVRHQVGALLSAWTHAVPANTSRGKVHWLRRAAFIAGLLLPTLALAVDVQVSSFTDSPDPAPRGGQISYTITALNSDADTANNVVVTFALPANTVFVSVADAAVPGACAHDGGSPGVITCTYPTLLGTLAAPTAGPMRTITAVLRTTAATTNTVNALVTATTTDGDVNSGNNSLTQNTTINDGADLTAIMSGAPNPATGGGNVTWTVSGGNLGPNTSGPVTFTTTLPGVLTYLSASGTGWSCTPSGQVITCTRAAVAVGAYPDLAISTRITGVSGGTITLNGNMSSTVGDPDGSNHSPVASVSVDPGTDLADHARPADTQPGDFRGHRHLRAAAFQQRALSGQRRRPGELSAAGRFLGEQRHGFPRLVVHLGRFSGDRELCLRGQPGFRRQWHAHHRHHRAHRGHHHHLFGHHREHRAQHRWPG
jgi:uncharacterized repeat protein (TIGR01451 family)